MIETKKIIEAAERKLQGTDMFVVGCTCTPGNDIELLIDLSLIHISEPTRPY